MATTIRPNAEPPVSSVLTGDIFLIDGATGVRALAATSVVQALPYTQPGSGAVAQTLAGKLSAQVNILDFGAIADTSTPYSATNATTNATALMNALATGKAVSIPYNANGYSFAGSTVVLATGQCISGENQVLLKSQPATNGWMFHVTGSGGVNNPVIIKDINIDLTGAGTGTTAIRLATTSAAVSGCNIANVVITNAIEALGDEGTNGTFNLYTHNFIMRKTLGRQIYIRKSGGFIYLHKTLIDHTLNPALVTFEGARFEQFAGVQIDTFDVGGFGTGTPAYNSAVSGLVFDGTVSGQAIWLNRIDIDSSIGDGIHILNTQYVQANELFAGLARGHQITLNNVTNAIMTNVQALGSVGLTGAAIGADGVRILNSFNIQISNNFSTNNTGNGLDINTSNSVTVKGVQSISDGNGIAIQGTSANVLINGGAVATPISTAFINTSTGGNVVVRYVAGLPWRTAVADAAYTALPSDDEIAYTSITAARVVTLPAAANYPQGRILPIKDVAGLASATLTISVDPAGTDTLLGSSAAQVVVSSAYGVVELESDGVSKWTFPVRGVNAGGTGVTSIPQLLAALSASQISVAATVNFNVANTDTPFALPPLPSGFTRYIVGSIRISGASHTLVTANFGVFTAAAAGGTAVVTAATALTVSATTDATNNNAQLVTANNATTQSYLFSNSPTLFFRVGTAEGAAATASVEITLIPLP